LANQVIKAFLLGAQLPYKEDGKGKAYSIIVNPGTTPIIINIPQNNYFKVIYSGLDTKMFRNQWEVNEYLTKLLKMGVHHE